MIGASELYSGKYVNTANRVGARAAAFQEGYPTETLTDNGDGTWSLQPDFWFNDVKSGVAANQLKYTSIMHNASGTANGKLIIYTNGHEGDDASYAHADANIAAVKAACPDYDVLQGAMLGYDYNSSVANAPLDLGDLTPHELLSDCFPIGFMKWHMWHLIAALNTFDSLYTDIYLCGLSGGALMSLFVGGLDERVKGVWTFSGNYPDWMIHAEPPTGDGEQNYSPMLSHASRMGLMKLCSDNFHRGCWDTTDTVVPMTVAQGAILAAQIPTMNVTVTEGDTQVYAAGHSIRTSWLTTMAADLAGL